MAFTDDQIMALNAAPNDAPMFGNPQGPGISSWWGGRGVGGPAGQESGFGGFNPGTPAPPSLWDKLIETAGELGKDAPKMPGTTVGAPGGSAPPPLRLPGQMPTPPGLGAYFHAMQNPAQGGGLMAQYMALQRLMQGG